MSQEMKITTKVVTSSIEINNFISVKDLKMMMVMIIRIIIKVMIVEGENQTEMKGLWMWKEPCLPRVLEVVMV